MRWSLRPGRPEDAAALLRVSQAGFETYRSFAPPGWQPPDEAVWEERLGEEIADPTSFTHVADGEDGVAGYVHWIRSVTPSRDGTTPALHLRMLFVMPPYWGTGVARELHDLAVAAMGGEDARLFTPEGQARARRFYEREGWRLHEIFFEDRLGLSLAEYRRP